jgi:hypothetical protein
MVELPSFECIVKNGRKYRQRLKCRNLGTRPRGKVLLLSALTSFRIDDKVSENLLCFRRKHSSVISFSKGITNA